MHAKSHFDALVGLSHILEATPGACHHIDEVGATASDVVHGPATALGVFALETTGGVEAWADHAYVWGEARTFAFVIGTRRSVGWCNRRCPVQGVQPCILLLPWYSSPCQ